MRNTWLHAFAMIAFAAPVLALSLWLAADVAQEWHEPARVLALLAPGLALGWFTRRHPLLVGAAVGILAVAMLALANATGPVAAPMLTATMVVAVAALAGRALRFRFRPGPTTPDARGR